MRTQPEVAGFEDGKGPQTKESGKPLDARKGKEMESPLEPPEGIQPCQHLNFSSVRCISDFRPPEPYDNQLVLFLSQ